MYKRQQYQIGACQIKDIAVALACPVVAKHDDRQELIIYGGGVHLSKDRIIHPKNQKAYFGLAYPLSKKGWDLSVEASIVKSLSQEHGILQATDSFYKETQIGDLIAILPIHSCMTANLLKSFTSLDGAVFNMMP